MATVTNNNITISTGIITVPVTELKPVENTGSEGFVKTTSKLGVNTLTTSNVKFTLADRTDLSDRPYGNLFSSFNLPVTTTEMNKFTGSTGVYKNTAFSGLSQDKILIVEIPTSEYGELIDGKTVYLKFPINSGGTDTIINCYGTYFFRDVNNYDNFLSDIRTESAYFGAQLPNVSLGKGSNVAYLFSNEIATPKRATGLTWNTWSTTNKFSNGGKELATFNSSRYSDATKIDEPVGIAFLDKGFFVITHPTLVNNFIYSAATSSGYDGIISGSSASAITDGKYTQVYFTSADSASTSFNSVVTEYVQNIVANAMPNEFFESNNPTFQAAYPTGNVDNDPVYITEIGLYNEDGELIGIGKTSEPIPKTKDGYALFNIQLKV